MAKKSRMLSLSRASTPAPVLVMAPRGGRVRRSAGRAGRAMVRAGRRAGGFARRSAKSHLPVTGIAIGGLLVGYMDAKGMFAKVPAIGNSRALTLGLLGYAATRFVKHPLVRTAGVAAIAAAAFDYGKVHGLGGKKGASGIDEGTGAHDGGEDYQGDGGPY